MYKMVLQIGEPGEGGELLEETRAAAGKDEVGRGRGEARRRYHVRDGCRCGARGKLLVVISMSEIRRLEVGANLFSL